MEESREGWKGMVAWMGGDKWVSVHMGMCMEERLCSFWLQYHISQNPSLQEARNLTASHLD